MACGLDPWLQQQLGQPVLQRHPIAGGCIHRAWRVELAGGSRVFVKTNHAAALPMLEAEVDGLRALASLADDGLQVPRPQVLGCCGDQAVLVLSWLPLTAAGDTAAWHGLGRSLALLHRSSLDAGPGQGSFGWCRDNFIGSTPQINGWSTAWGDFFTHRRLAPQLALAARRGLHLRGAACVLEQVTRWLEPHRCEPVLVHGDLWSGNGGLLVGGGGALFDPAVYRADREVDLAMARLFGGFPPAFFAGYAAAWPLPAGVEGRVGLYNLYHLLNHANLFGGDYGRQAQACIDRLLA